jgi:hypothetical protein
MAFQRVSQVEIRAIWALGIRGVITFSDDDKLVRAS